MKAKNSYAARHWLLPASAMTFEGWMAYAAWRKQLSEELKAMRAQRYEAARVQPMPSLWATLKALWADLKEFARRMKRVLEAA